MTKSNSQQPQNQLKIHDPERTENLNGDCSSYTESKTTTSSPSATAPSDSNATVANGLRFVEKSNQKITQDQCRQVPNAKNGQDMLEALRRGGIVCLLPHVIQPHWRGPAALLAGFPIVIHFTGLPPVANPEAAQFFIASCYWFDPATYREDDDRRTMLYTSRPQGDFFLELRYWKCKQSWEGFKYRGNEWILSAKGADLNRFIVQLTCCGIAEGELVQPILNLADTASSGVYIFEPGVA